MDEKYDERFCVECELLTLDEEHEEKLKKWVESFCEKQPSINYHRTSYGLKHIAEKSLGFYVSNADIKKAMIEAGFISNSTKYVGEKNWRFNISNSSRCFKRPLEAF